MLSLLVLALPLLLLSPGHAAPAPSQDLERVGIVGGQEAPGSKWPWQVSLDAKRNSGCTCAGAPSSTPSGC
ncbi:unnamed protein product [Pipistrellus nathusii]|uniref:Uncharacterized protein n=1 Tax=Pipistrellus nathusii TaxID=59473 RepID=A0ABP0A2Y3_PIPNA